MRLAAILPSRNEASTIAAVTSAVDTALDNAAACIVHADSSDTLATSKQFAATHTRAATVSLTGLVRGKGTQILTAARHLDVTAADVVLIADTDTRNPDPAVYRALIDHVQAGVALAIADYPRYWDEANLTNHIARPLIAATTGHDIPQPLAGDLAISRQALTATLRASTALPVDLVTGVAGYGIDALLLLTAATIGPVVSVRVDQPKQHAGSFPHLPDIYHQAVPVLLHLTASWGRLSTTPAREPAVYRTAHRDLPLARLRGMVAALATFTPAPDGHDQQPWPVLVAHAWFAVHSGTPATHAARQLWPNYVRRVRDWLTEGQYASAGQQSADTLAAAHSRLHTTIRTATGACR
jgi:hypothetical protein